MIGEQRSATGLKGEIARLAERYDPRASYEVKSEDVEYRHDGQRSWLARVYQPQGSGPFPTLIEIHGGAWNNGDRLQNVPNDEALAASGLVVAAIDFRMGGDAPYPSSLQDINYAIRWLKVHAADFNGTAAALGGIGFSSGGHLIILSAMRPADPRYTALPFDEAPDVDARLAYAIACWPVIDPYARTQHARATGRQNLVESGLRFFGDEAGMKEGNPQELLERGEQAELPPTLILIGAADDILTPTMAERFVTEYSKAGGVIELAKYPGAGHGFTREPTDNAARALAAG